MGFEFRDYYANESRGFRIDCKKAEIAPLVEEVAIDIDAVWLAQVLGYESSYSGEILRFENIFIVDVAEF